MGTNRRYEADYDRLGEERTLAGYLAKGGLQTLKERELDLEKEPVTTDPDPKPVRAWVRFYDYRMNIPAYARRWASRAVEIVFTARGKEYSTWVWTNAVSEDKVPRPRPDR
ncbi:hypothetical protein [Microbacterium candidum]|uniref:Uncharacterized protein n=1 Tax=Microbacterium candidum TaxID=3041922 RepID=A0ABT7MVX2_9MICO|nr:hypothetical protein [Microbacterium sp. ASV49]MDL9978610.1 hypothetical protein [Microbacterium sp. ASV49]